MAEKRLANMCVMTVLIAQIHEYAHTDNGIKHIFKGTL